MFLPAHSCRPRPGCRPSLKSINGYRSHRSWSALRLPDLERGSTGVEAVTALEKINDYTARLMKLGLPEREARQLASRLVLGKK